MVLNRIISLMENVVRPVPALPTDVKVEING